MWSILQIACMIWFLFYVLSTDEFSEIKSSVGIGEFYMFTFNHGMLGSFFPDYPVSWLLMSKNREKRDIKPIIP